MFDDLPIVILRMIALHLQWPSLVSLFQCSKKLSRLAHDVVFLCSWIPSHGGPLLTNNNTTVEELRLFSLRHCWLTYPGQASRISFESLALNLLSGKSFDSTETSEYETMEKIVQCIVFDLDSYVLLETGRVFREEKDQGLTSIVKMTANNHTALFLRENGHVYHAVVNRSSLPLSSLPSPFLSGDERIVDIIALEHTSLLISSTGLMYYLNIDGEPVLHEYPKVFKAYDNCKFIIYEGSLIRDIAKASGSLCITSRGQLRTFRESKDVYHNCSLRFLPTIIPAKMRFVDVVEFTFGYDSTHCGVVVTEEGDAFSFLIKSEEDGIDANGHYKEQEWPIRYLLPKDDVMDYIISYEEEGRSLYTLDYSQRGNGVIQKAQLIGRGIQHINRDGSWLNLIHT